MTLLSELNDWSERENSTVLITRRGDLNCPDEWSVILTAGEIGAISQYHGTGMSPEAAIVEALAKAGARVRPDEYIEWWDMSDENARWRKHVGCDEGERPWLTPLDDCPAPSATEEECARCAHIVPLVKRTGVAA